jgi:hypothetical protein
MNTDIYNSTIGSDEMRLESWSVHRLVWLTFRGFPIDSGILSSDRPGKHPSTYLTTYLPYTRHYITSTFRKESLSKITVNNEYPQWHLYKVQPTITGSNSPSNGTECDRRAGGQSLQDTICPLSRNAGKQLDISLRYTIAPLTTVYLLTRLLNNLSVTNLFVFNLFAYL